MNIFKNLYDYRELLKTSIKKDIRGKYKNSVLGIFWSFLNPLLQIAVYALVFSIIVRNNTEKNYTVFICCGLIPWTFFSTAISRASFTMIENGNIIKKVYFPREILPVSLVTSEMVNFIISTIIILGFVLVNGFGITKYILFYPIVLLVQYFLILGIAFFVSSITVFFRDLQHFIGVLLQLLFYAAPIVFPASSIPENFKWIIKYNPMTYIINSFRDIFYYQQTPNFMALMVVLLIGIVLCILGYLFFSKSQKKFAEEL